MKNTVKLSESQLRKIVAESVRRVLKEAYGTSLRQFMKTEYKTDPYNTVHNKLWDDTFIKQQGWFRVWHEGYGDGIYSPSEGIVAVYDEDDLDEYATFHFYKYNPKSWIKTDDGGLDDIYNGNNGSGFDVEPID